MASISSLIPTGLNARVARLGSRSSFWGAAARLAGGAGASHLIVMASSPVVTRLYAPEDFSAAGVCLSFAAVATVFTTLRYEYAIVSADEAAEAKSLFTLALGVAVPMSALAALALWWLSYLDLAGWGEISGFVLVLMPLLLYLMSAHDTLRQWSVRESQYSGIGKSLFLQGVGKSGGQIALGLVKGGAGGLLLGEIVARVVGSITLLAVQPLRWSTLRQEFRWADCRTTARKYAEFPLLSLPSAALNRLAANLAVPLIAYAYGPYAAGSFFLMRRAVSLPMIMLGRSVADVFHKHLAASATKSNRASLAFLDRTVLRLAAIAVVPALLAYVVGPRLVVLLFGSDWTLAAKFTSAMTLWTLAQFCVGPATPAVNVYRAFRFKLFYDGLTLTGSVTAVLGAWGLGYSVVAAVNALALMNVAAYVTYYLILRYVVKNSIRESIDSHAREL